MAMIWRTTDLLKWGAGKGSKLTKIEIDGNFWELLSRLVALETNPPGVDEITNITLVGSQLTIFTSSGGAFGPYTIPVSVFHFAGTWLAGATYSELDLVRVEGLGLYLVLDDHVAAATFNPAATGPNGALYLHMLPEGSNEFISLSDTPADWTDSAGKAVVVNPAGDGLIFQAQPYEVGGYFPSAPTASQIILRFLSARAVAFPIDFAGSQAHASVAATAATDFDIQKNGASVGTLSFAAAATVGTFVAAAGVTLAAADRLDMVGPATPDATLAGISWLLAGTR